MLRRIYLYGGLGLLGLYAFLAVSGRELGSSRIARAAPWFSGGGGSRGGGSRFSGFGGGK